MDNKKIAAINFTTSFGDYLSTFAIAKLIFLYTSSAIEGGYIVAFESLGICFACLFFPKLVSLSTTKSIIFYSQMIAGFLMLSVSLFSFQNITLPLYYVYFVFFFQNLTRQLFENSIESHSHRTTESSNHRKEQARLLVGDLSAKVLAPLVSLALLFLFPIWVPIGIDSITFFLAAMFSLKLSKNLKYRELSIKKAVRAFRDRAVLEFFILYIVIMPISLALFNFLIFDIVVSNLNLKIENSAIFYSLIALGGLFYSYQLVKTRYLDKYSEITLLVFALISTAILRLILVNTSTLSMAVILLLLGGLASSIRTNAGKTIIRKLIRKDLYPEYISFQNLIRHVVIFFTIFITKNYFTGENTTKYGFYIASVIPLGIGVLFLFSRNLKSKTDPNSLSI